MQLLFSIKKPLDSDHNPYRRRLAADAKNPSPPNILSADIDEICGATGATGFDTDTVFTLRFGGKLGIRRGSDGSGGSLK